MSKADEIRARLEHVATWRLAGQTWPQVAAALTADGVPVTGDEIRAYWPRLAENRSPAEYLLYARALWQGRGGERLDRLKQAEAQAKAAKVEAARLAAALAEAQAAMDEATKPQRVPEELIAFFKNAGYAEASVEISTAMTARDQALAERDKAKSDLVGWMNWARQLAEIHQTQDLANTKSMLDGLVVWAANPVSKA